MALGDSRNLNVPEGALKLFYTGLQICEGV
jgi:hypothetical protein